MIETRLVAQAVADIQRRLDYITEQNNLERQQGLDADWTAVAEAFEGIREMAEHGASAAWRVAYESEAIQ